MRYGAKLMVLFGSAILLISSLVSSCCTRLEQTNKSNGNRSPFANFFFISAAFSAGRSGCPGMGCPDLSSHLVSGSLS